MTFKGYEINGNTFYTIAQDKKSTNQNSGVRFDAATENGQKVTYYGYIEEIWELDYGPSFKVPLFRCKWFKLTGGGVKVDQQYGMTMVDFNNLGYLDEPFVLAKDVAQVFYLKDMTHIYNKALLNAKKTLTFKRFLKLRELPSTFNGLSSYRMQLHHSVGRTLKIKNILHRNFYRHISTIQLNPLMIICHFFTYIVKALK